MEPFKQRGFTLIEVLIATFIMVSVLGALVYGLSQSLNLTEAARNQDIALNAAQKKLEEIANNLSTITAYNGQGFPVKDTQGNTLLTGPGTSDPGSVTITPVEEHTNLYNAEITVTWIQRDNRQLSQKLTTVFLQK